MSAKNPCAKRVTPETAYEVWQSSDGTFTYFVLKKYQSPEQEAKNPYARWYCAVASSFLHPPLANVEGKPQLQFEYGDAYVSTVKRGTHQIDNPLHRTICVKRTSIQTLEESGLSDYPLTDLVSRDARLWHYLKLSVPPKDFHKVKRMLEEHEIAIVCIDAQDFVERCLEDEQTTGEQDGTARTG